MRPRTVAPNGGVHPHRKDDIGDDKVVCYKCLHGGILLCCCGKGCPRRYHRTCLDPPLNCIPPGFWHCIWCVKEKIKLGVHSVSEGVEYILDSREVFSKDNVMQKEYFVKYQCLAHAHNCWISEKQMLLEAPTLLEKFRRKKQAIKWKKDWSIPHRLLLKREITKNDQHSVCSYEWLVKWTGLGYDHATWELDNASFMTSSEGMKLIDDYECRRKRADALSNPLEANEERKASFAKLSELSCGDSPGFYNQHLSYVNSLRMCLHKGQRSALILDDQFDQDRIMKVILFILSLNCNVKRPILIISTSIGLSGWETEFLHLAPSANLVVYKGNKDVRSSIRALEFYNEDGGILFQILLSSSDIIVEDLHALRCIPWEVIIIDECQRSRILGHLDNIKILASEMRLLVSGKIKEDENDYIKLLSFLKSGHQELNTTKMESCSSASISNLKSQLEQYVAFKCHSGSSRFVEYWVPAQLSSLQLEQYCSMLLSNSMLLCSGQKSDSVDALRGLIISTRKCCNHPFLLDPSLHHFVTRGLPLEKHLDIGIKASGKLQLLEKILFEARSRGLRVLLLFQSSSGSGSIGDILDDVLCQRFGKDCYVRYARDYTPSKKQAALDTFNDRKSGKFVFLVESRACLPSVKLSSVDSIILFDSDWDRQIDLRCLQKMYISSQFQQLKVFRLYSYFTVEEKVLMLAKEGGHLHSNMQLINQSTSYHTLLNWGASYLFSKLDDLHGSGPSVSAADISDQSILNDVVGELSSKLVCGSGDTDCHEQSFISKIQQNGGEYARNILLQGEREMKKLGNEPHTFSWSDLKGRRPKWKFLSVSSQRIRKTVKNFDHIIEKSKDDNDSIIRKRSRESEDNVYPKKKKVTKDNVDPKGRKVTKNNVDPKRWEVSKDIVDPETKKVSQPQDTVDSKYLKKKLKNKKNQSAGNRASKLNGSAVRNKQFSKQKKLPDMPKSTKLLSMPEISSLCDVLHFSKDVKAFTMGILELILKYYNVSCLEGSGVQAFEISVCWLAASLLEHKIDRKKSLDLAKLHLNFDCTEEEATDVYSELQKYRKEVSSFIQKGLCVEKNTVEEKRKGFQGPHVLNLVKSDTNEHDPPTQSPTTVLSLQDQIHIEKFHSGQMAQQICPSRKTPGRPVEADATSMESDANERTNAVTGSLERQSSVISTETAQFEGIVSEDPQTLINEVIYYANMSTHSAQRNSVDAYERTRAVTSEAAQVSFIGSRNEVPNSSYDPNNVNPATGSLERQSPIISTETAQSGGIVSEDPQTIINEAIYYMNMSVHPAQRNSVETDTLACAGTAVSEVRQWYNTASPVCGESTTIEFAETTLPYMQPSRANLNALPQMFSSDIPSFMEDLSSIVTPYLIGRDNCYTHEVEEILQARMGLVEPVSSSFVSPSTLQPSAYVPVNENAAHSLNDITTPGYMSSDNFQAHPVTSEMHQVAYPDPLDIERARIKKMYEEAEKIHKEKKLQLQSDYHKEVEKLGEKYRMLLQNDNTTVALKIKDIEARQKLVLRNMELAEARIQTLDIS